MPLIKHQNPKNYIDKNGNMYGDIDLRMTQPRVIYAESAYYNKYRGGAPSAQDILDQLNKNRKGRNGN